MITTQDLNRSYRSLDTIRNTPYYCSENLSNDISAKSLIDFFRKTVIRGEPSRKFDFVKNGVHFLAEVTTRKVLNEAKKIICLIEKTKLISFSESQIYREAPQNEEEFIQSLSRLHRIVEPSIDPEEAKEEADETPVCTTTAFKLKNGIEVTLSNEMLENMAGHRGSDHHLSVDLIQTCAHKLQNKFKTMEANRALPFYFRSSKSEHSVLAMVFLKYLTALGEPKILAYTGYYMPNSSIKYHLNFRSDTELEAWKSRLPLI